MRGTWLASVPWPTLWGRLFCQLHDLYYLHADYFICHHCWLFFCWKVHANRCIIVSELSCRWLKDYTQPRTKSCSRLFVHIIVFLMAMYQPSMLSKTWMVIKVLNLWGVLGFDALLLLALGGLQQGWKVLQSGWVCNCWDFWGYWYLVSS